MKKQYMIPQIEVSLMGSAIGIMKTSVELLPDMAPQREEPF